MRPGGVLFYSHRQCVFNNTAVHRFEILLSRFEQSRRFEVFTSDMHKETLEENSRIVDHNEKLQRLLSEAQEEIQILRRGTMGHYHGARAAFGHDSSPSPQNSISIGERSTSAFIQSDGVVPLVCPLGGCTQYEMVHQRGSDVMKNFQNHMNNTHRVRLFLSIFI